MDSWAGSRGRLQDVWESGGGAGAYDLLLAVGTRLHPWVPDVLGGGMMRDFFRVADRLRLRGGETVLDLACGPGTLTAGLADAVGPTGLVIGADLSPPMLTRASRAVRRANTVFVRADAMALPLPEASVDAVSCSLCLHLVPDLDTALAQITRVLRPGGRLATTVPAHAPGAARVITERLARAGQARLFAPGEPAGALARHGLTVGRERRSAGLQIVDATAPG